MIKTSGDLAGKFNMRYLIRANGNVACLVNQNIGALQQGITEEAIGIDVLVFQVVLHVFIARYAFKPAERRHHGEEKVKLCMFGNSGLDKQGRCTGRNPGSEPVDHHVPDAVFNDLRIFVMSGQRVPVGDKKETLIFVLQLDPVVYDSVQMPKVQAPGGTHAGQHAPLRFDGTQNLLPGKTTCR